MSETDSKSSREARAERRQKRLLEPPRFTILGDQPLAAEDIGDDSFDLARRIGPLYDILRHPDTPTPMAMAIYGDWGVGKTSAMRWLDGQLDAWRKNGKAEQKITVRSAWFYPWKYQTKEDVWRGLVSEIIIACIEAENPSVKAYLSAVEDFGAFLGKSFVSVIAGTKLTLGFWENAKLTLDGKSVKEITKHAEELFSPQNAFLNEFENTIRRWIGENLGEQERMVVFIDDLDRCLPEVALQVLEALKLYLNIENLVFVVGVDREVVDTLVGKHYERLGLGAEKSGSYLAKMFSVEVTLAPSDPEIDQFLDDLLDENAAWQDLADKEREIFRGLIRKLATRSPREAKRLINSSLMAGAGARMSSLADEPAKQAPTVAQGMQVFFVRRILHDRYTHGSLVAQNRGTDFFTAWSQILEKDGRIPQTVTVPSGYVEKLQALRDQPETQRAAEGGSDARAELDTTLSDLPGAYHELLESIAFADLFGLLQDEDLGRLMRISYPAEAAAIGGELGDRAGAKILHEAIARQLNKAPERLTRSDYQEIRELDLVSQEIRDLTAVQSLKKLHTLSLNGTSISDLDPLRGLSDLQRLDLSRTLVTDLTALGDMAALRELDLANTRITDLTPLKRLPALQKLRLAGTTCSLDALKTLTNLKKLSLANREGLADIKPLRGLTCLEELNLFGTAVSDLHPLEKMTALQELNLRHTRVSDLAPLRDMKGLQRLDLSDTRVGNLNPLKELAALQYLSIGSLKDEIDLEPLRGLPGLRRLSIVYSKVRSLQPLKGLSSLQALNLNSTGVAKEEIDDLQQALPNLEITDVDTDPRALH